MNIIESFFIALGYQVSTKELDQFMTQAKGAAATAAKIGAVIVGAATGLGIFTQQMAKSLGDTSDFAELNNMTARSVEALGKVALENDSSIEGMRSSLQSLNGMVGQAALGIGRGAMLFKKIGLTARDADGKVKGLDVILEDVADRMSQLSRQENLAIANKLGIDPMLVKTLEKGSGFLRELREEAEAMNPLTEEDYKLADEVDRLFIKASASAGMLTKMLAAKLLPIAKRVLTFYLEWVKSGRKNNAIINGLTKALNVLGNVLGSAWEWLVRIYRVLETGMRWLLEHKAVWGLLGGVLAIILAYQVGTFFFAMGAAVLAATRAVMAFNLAAAMPAIVLGLIVGAIILLVDELVNFYEGNESLIGQLAKDFPAAIYLAWGALAVLIAGLGTFVGWWAVGGAAVVAGIWWLWNNWDKATTMMRDAFGGVLEVVTKVVDAIGSFFGKAGNVISVMAAPFSSGLQQAASTAMAPFREGGILGPAATAGGPTNNTTATTITGTNITIQTNDPVKAGGAVRAELERMAQSAARNGQSAVAL